MSTSTAYQIRNIHSIILPTLLLLASLLVLLLAVIMLSTNGLWLVSAVEPHAMPSPPILGQPLGNFPFLVQITTPKENIVFVATFSMLFLLYFLSLRYLPKYTSFRYIISATALLGLCYILIPMDTSQDVFSYIAYARMEVLYHLNPMIATPAVIHNDPTYHLLYWRHQPSIYGPTWVLITSGLQQFAFLLGFTSVLFMQLLMRLWGFAMHLGSLYLVRQLYLTTHYKASLPSVECQRGLRILLAFAWNPFLLLEACVNAHTDTTILFLILAALYFLGPTIQKLPGSYLFTAVFLGIAACLKISMLVFFPGLLLFLWLRPRREMLSGRFDREKAIIAAVCVYIGIILLLYFPFWQHGAMLHTLEVTPGTSRDINSIYEFFVHIYASLMGVSIPSDNVDTGSWVEIVSHQVSMAIFGIIYATFCLRSLLFPDFVNSLPALICWMALVWFLYCLFGSPWFWPWYMTTFLGLSTIVRPVFAEKTPGRLISQLFTGKSITSAMFAHAMSVSMVSMYCFAAWPSGAYSIPFFSNIQWLYLRGLLIWIPPFLALYVTLYVLPMYFKKERTIL